MERYILLKRRIHNEKNSRRNRPPAFVFSIQPAHKKPVLLKKSTNDGFLKSCHKKGLCEHPEYGESLPKTKLKSASSKAA